MPLPDLSGLPIWAQVLIYTILGLSIAVAFLVARFGVAQGAKASPAASAAQAQVAAVIVDPTALNKAAGEVAGLAVAITEAMAVVRAHTAAVDRQADKIDGLAEGVDKLRDELIRASARMK